MAKRSLKPPSAAESLSTVKEAFLCLKEKNKYVKDLEDLLAKVTIFYSRKKEVERILENGLPKRMSSRKRNNYNLFLHVLKAFDKKYKKFVTAYQRHCKSLLSLTASTTGSGTAEEPSIITRNFFTLAKLSRRIKKLYYQVWLITEIVNLVIYDTGNKMTESGEIVPCYDYFIPKSKHYLLAFKGNDIELQFDPKDPKRILVGNCLSAGPLEKSSEESLSSRVEIVINLVEKNLKELSKESAYPYASVLFLQRNNELSVIDSSFFDNMPELCFLDLSDTRIRILPSSLFRLPKLKVLLLRNCTYMPDIPAEIENLSTLEVLDLGGTEQYYLPVQMRGLVRLRHADLSLYGTEYDDKYKSSPREAMIPYGVLSEFKELESLSITVHRDDPRWARNAACILEDLVNLERLSFLQFYFPKVESFEAFIRESRSWTNGSLRSFKFIVGPNMSRFINIVVPSEVESVFDERVSCLRFVRGHYIPEEIKSVVKRVGAFYLDSHVEIESLSEFGYMNFKILKWCLLTECPKLGVIFENKGTEHCFLCIEYLWLYGLGKLEHIWEPPIESTIPMSYGSFKCLKSLTVNNCPELKFILLESTLHNLSNLEELNVEWCASVETIVKDDMATKKLSINDETEELLPRLKTVALTFLPELVSLGNGLSPSKQGITIVACENLILNSSEPKKETRDGSRRIPSLVKLRSCLGEI